MHELNHKVTYSQLSPDKTVKPTELLCFFQDAAVAHTTACGYSLEKLAEENSAWILLSTRLVMEQPIYLSDEITIQTWPYSFSKASGPRAFIVKNTKNNRIDARAVSVWAYVDTLSGRPKVIPNDILTAFGEGDNFELEYIRRPPKIDPDIHVADFSVLKRDLDSNGHMNNVRYVEYAMEAVPNVIEIYSLEIYYKRPLLYGEKFSLFSIKDELGNIHTVLKNEHGEICTYISFVIK